LKVNANPVYTLMLCSTD